MMYNFERRQY